MQQYVAQSSRNLRVYSTPDGSSSRIILQGKWLSSWGFSKGDYLEVTRTTNQIIITKVAPPIEEPKVNVKTKLPKQTIHVVREHALQYGINENEIIEKAVLYYLKQKGVI